LIEDIDCAFPTRSEEDEDEPQTARNPYDMGMGMGMGMMTPSYIPGAGAGRRSAVTLSGLLNVLDGVGSEEGKLFFATVGSSPSHFANIEIHVCSF
jgi:chaperone BCS1